MRGVAESRFSRNRFYHSLKGASFQILPKFRQIAFYMEIEEHNDE